jgi:outer membrane protein, multidrug efflux system
MAQTSVAAGGGAMSSFGVRHPRRWRGVWIIVALLVGSCATQAPYQRPAIPVEASWSNAGIDAAGAIDAVPALSGERWWSRLHDPAIDALAAATLADNPTLAQAAAAIDEARATLQTNQSARLPAVGLSGSAARARAPNPQFFAKPFTVLENSTVGGPALSWELDLWGRVRQSAQAADARLSARGADANEARISLMAQIASGVLSLRACEYSLAVRDRDIAARELELTLMRRRLAVGRVAPVEEATANTNLANARTDQISQQEECTRTEDFLAALSGQDISTVRALVARLTGPDSALSVSNTVALPPIEQIDPATLMPMPPPLPLELPATVLLHHPRVVSAEREVAARWSDIAVARADRLPTVDLAAALTGNWLQAFGKSVSFATWSVGGDLSTPLFDGGAGDSRVRGAQARYAGALAELRATVRSAAQDVEDALAAQRSAEQRVATSQQAVQNGRVSLRANEARWRVGSISVFELEDARRQFNGAQEREIAAARDRAQAWVELIRASANNTDGDTPSALVSNAQSESSGG